MPKKNATPKKREPVSDGAETNFLRSEATIFISYRRDDSKDEAAYLKALLARRFGEEKIFRDLDSIKLGADFPEVINNALVNASVVIVLIGKRWLTVKTKEGQPRIETSGDYVRIEIETALKLGKPIIPVYLNGASALEKTQLPHSIARLPVKNAVGLSWFEGCAKITKAIKDVEKQIEVRKAKEKEKENSFNLEYGDASSKKDKKSLGKGMIIAAMEYSLKRTGKKISLDEKDFYKILDHYADPLLRNTGAFWFPDMAFVIDFIGIKERTGDKRYIARSIPLHSIAEVPAQLALKRPVICGFTVYEGWFEHNVSKTGLIDFKKPIGQIQGGTVGVIIGWNPVKEQIKLLTPWHSWGKKGVATLSKDALFHISTNEMRAIEAIEKTSPFSKPLIEMSKKMTAGNKRQPPRSVKR